MQRYRFSIPSSIRTIVSKHVERLKKTVVSCCMQLLGSLVRVGVIGRSAETRSGTLSPGGSACSQWVRVVSVWLTPDSLVPLGLKGWEKSESDFPSDLPYTLVKLVLMDVGLMMDLGKVAGSKKRWRMLQLNILMIMPGLVWIVWSV